MKKILENIDYYLSFLRTSNYLMKCFTFAVFELFVTQYSINESPFNFIFVQWLMVASTFFNTSWFLFKINTRILLFNFKPWISFFFSKLEFLGVTLFVWLAFLLRTSFRHELSECFHTDVMVFINDHNNVQ